MTCYNHELKKQFFASNWYKYKAIIYFWSQVYHFKHPCVCCGVSSKTIRAWSCKHRIIELRPGNRQLTWHNYSRKIRTNHLQDRFSEKNNIYIHLHQIQVVDIQPQHIHELSRTLTNVWCTKQLVVFFQRFATWRSPDFILQPFGDHAMSCISKVRYRSAVQLLKSSQVWCCHAFAKSWYFYMCFFGGVGNITYLKAILFLFFTQSDQSLTKLCLLQIVTKNQDQKWKCHDISRSNSAPHLYRTGLKPSRSTSRKFASHHSGAVARLKRYQRVVGGKG